MASSNYVDPEGMASASRGVSVFEQGLNGTVAYGHSEAGSLIHSFGPEPAGAEMRIQYEQVAGGLWESLDSFREVLRRLGDTAKHSAVAWDSTSQGPGGHSPLPADVPVEHAPAGEPHAPVKK